MNIQDLAYPVVAFSTVGWSKEASEPHDLTDASYDDDLSDWQAS